MTMLSPTPYAYIQFEQMKKNIEQMITRLATHGIDHRPHIKTHKSVEIAKLQLAYGAKGITVAKLSEAEVMANGGIHDILIAFPIIGTINLQRLQVLHEKINLRTTVDSIQVAEGLSQVGERIGKPVDVLIEMDGGTHRGGVQAGEDVLHFARSIRHLPGIRVMGVLSYFGQIYGSQNITEIKSTAEQEASMLLAARSLLEQDGFSIEVLSGGSTASSFFPDQLKGITESRAGNYIFGDMNAINLGLMKSEECALRIRSTVVSKPLPGYASIDAGSKTLTSDLSIIDSTYGAIVGMPEVKLVKLNEEHGYLRYDPNDSSLQIGDLLEIIPNHSCVISNMNDTLLTVEAEIFTGHISIDARGRNY